MSGTCTAYCAVMSGIHIACRAPSLRACYAMSGIDIRRAVAAGKYWTSAKYAAATGGVALVYGGMSLYHRALPCGTDKAYRILNMLCGTAISYFLNPICGVWYRDAPQTAVLSSHIPSMFSTEIGDSGLPGVMGYLIAGRSLTPVASAEEMTGTAHCGECMYSMYTCVYSEM
eukprot:3940366-Rhodomonas_salina.1